jgi:nucleotide-binding universal stress UspA family protein
MAIRKVFVPLTGLAADRSALAAAFDVAKAHEARVEAGFLRFDQRYVRPKFPDRLTPDLFDELADLVAHTDTEEEAAATMFAEAREAAGLADRVPGSGKDAARGAAACWFGVRPAERILRDARLADVVVIGRAEPDEKRLAALRGTVLTTSGRPLLLAPPCPPLTLSGPVAIAWNGGTNAARAVAVALPFLERASRVDVLTVATARTRSSEGARLADYLACHGIDADRILIPPSAEPVGALLLRYCAELGSRLLVMGGQGRLSLSEYLLGGVTSQVFQQATIPVLAAL